MKPPAKPRRPVTRLDMLDLVERHLDIRMAARDIVAAEFGPDPERDWEVRAWELIAEIMWAASLEEGALRTLVSTARNRYGRWTPPSERKRAPPEEQSADEENTGATE